MAKVRGASGNKALPSVERYLRRLARDRALARRLGLVTFLVAVTAALMSTYGYWLGYGAPPDASRSKWELLRWLLGAGGCLLAACATAFRRWLAVSTLAVAVSSVLTAVWLTGVLGDLGIEDPAHPFSLLPDSSSGAPDETDTWFCPEAPRSTIALSTLEPRTVRFEGSLQQWQVDSSQAALCLDARDELPPNRAWLAEIHASYAAFAYLVHAKGALVLPSIELVQGKAKQVDDGLVAALLLELLFGSAQDYVSLDAWLRNALAEIEPGSEASAWIWGALAVGDRLSPSERQQLPSQAIAFTTAAANEVPSGLYEWSHELGCVYRLMRYLQTPFAPDGPVVRQMAQLLRTHPKLADAYAEFLTIQANLVNSSRGTTFLGLGSSATPGAKNVSFLPLARSRETDALAEGVATGGTMAAFIEAIQSGHINLTPTSESGFYDFLTFASEPFLLPERAPEYGRLLFTPGYRRRLRHAFATLQAKHRDTFGLMLASAEIGIAPAAVAPRLRVEPAPTHFLRMCRAYQELSRRLHRSTLYNVFCKIHGLSATGRRGQSLAQELEWISDLYLGLHLISSQDIGVANQLSDEDKVRAVKAESAALQWLSSWTQDPDLALDTRIAVELGREADQDSRVWATLGVRGRLLWVTYQGRVLVRPIRSPSDGPAKEWYDASGRAEYVLPSDEFVEFSAQRAPRRADLVRIGARAHNRAEWEAELRKGRP
jgi:hypothetical protein